MSASPDPTTAPPQSVTTLLRAVRDFATRHDAFDAVELTPNAVTCHAEGAPEEAYYRIAFDGTKLWGEWSSTDRYLSQSIEQVLVFTGDDLWDMIDEELVDFGWSQPSKLGPLEHFRNDDLEFVFRTAIPIDPINPPAGASRDLANVLLAFEAAMHDLGDMSQDEDDDD
ncbi:MAG: hypothetical protein ACTS3F_11495 [Phycisphaerales bacterium]